MIYLFLILYLEFDILKIIKQIVYLSDEFFDRKISLSQKCCYIKNIENDN